MESDLEPKSRAGKLARRWFWRIAMVVLLGPYAVIYLTTLFGIPMPGGWFGAWFMGALTIGGIVGTVEFSRNLKQHGLSELGCLLPVAAMTCWWGYLFLKEVGAIK
jgi:hypothetical protein